MSQEALKESIAHWERMAVMASPFDEVPGVDECALCVEYYWVDCGCVGCPVSIATGRPGCKGSPYLAADQAHTDWSGDPNDTELRDKFRAEAQKEILFLKALVEAE